MTYQVAGSAELAVVDKLQNAIAPREYNRRIEIDQMRVVRGIALCSTDSVWIMANIAGRILSANMLVMFREAVVIQNAVAAMAVVA
jgi:hypothetical protein